LNFEQAGYKKPEKLNPRKYKIINGAAYLFIIKTQKIQVR